MGNILAALYNSFKQNRTSSVLYRLTDRQLDDIGLRRDQIYTRVFDRFNS